MTPALSIENLTVEYPLADGSVFTAVAEASLTVMPGAIHALVGESGAGKTTIGSAVMGLLERPGRIAAGTIRIAGRVIDPMTGRGDGVVLGRDVGAVFQDPMTSLNPLFTVEAQLCETLRHHLRLPPLEARARALELLRAVGIPEPERRLGAYPHQLSGGQRQRVVIACALSCDPKLIVADEPTTALDVSVQAQILALLRRLADDRGVGVLLVTHNMGVVAEIADEVTIMHRGRVVEQGPAREVLLEPKADYARALIGAVPRVDLGLDRFPVPGATDERAAEARRRLSASGVRPGSTLPLAGRVARGAQSATEGRVGVAPTRRETPTPNPSPQGGGEQGRVPSPLLSIRDLTVDYGGRGLMGGGKSFRAVDGVSFDVTEGEIFGLVGESGCGKTTIANVVAGLVRPSGGSVAFRGEAIAGDGAARRPPALKRAVQMVFQDPYSSLNPRIRVGEILSEPILFYRLAASRAEARGDVETLLDAVGIERAAGGRFPHAFSGGQRQRLSIARALGARPALLVCDEPTSSLDVSVQAQLLNLLKDLRDATGLTLLLISHDLAVIRQMCDRIAVMRAGKIVELAEAEALFERPEHAYTRELMALVPTLEKIKHREPKRWPTSSS
jgi:peptide/nickel transport system ATP-binding protein